MGYNIIFCISILLFTLYGVIIKLVLHISYTPILFLVSLFDLVQLSPTGSFAKADYVEHAGYGHRKGLQPNGFLHLNEIQ